MHLFDPCEGGPWADRESARGAAEQRGAYAPSHRNQDHWRVDLVKSAKAIRRWGALRFLLELTFAAVMFTAILGGLFL